MTLIAASSIPASAPRTRYAVWLHRYAIGLAVCTFTLILVGSTVTTTDSGLAVPDWPTTFGENMFTYPPSKWVGGIFYEHGHRLVASAVGLLTIGMCLGLWWSHHASWLKWLGTAALIAVCLQGTLGGLTVRYHLPTPVSVAHSGLAEIFLCMTIVMAAATSPRWREIVWRNSATLRWCLVLLGCIYLQIIAGAIMRHTGSGLAIDDFPLSYGKLLPPTAAAELGPINLRRAWADTELPQVSLMQVWLHFAHRAGAIVVALAVVMTVRRVLRDPASTALAGLLALSMGALIVAQIVLGGMTIWTQRSLLMTTAHVGTGALMLAASLALALAVVDRKSRRCPTCQGEVTGSSEPCPQCSTRAAPGLETSE